MNPLVIVDWAFACIDLCREIRELQPEPNSCWSEFNRDATDRDRRRPVRRRQSCKRSRR
jgi:hypothetical protein